MNPTEAPVADSHELTLGQSSPCLILKAHWLCLQDEKGNGAGRHREVHTAECANRSTGVFSPPSCPVAMLSPELQCLSISTAAAHWPVSSQEGKIPYTFSLSFPLSLSLHPGESLFSFSQLLPREPGPTVDPTCGVRMPALRGLLCGNAALHSPKQDPKLRCSMFPLPFLFCHETFSFFGFRV